MPQMMPINWFLSLIIFISIFLMFNMMNYFIFNYKYFKMSNNNLKKNMSPLFWKW
uniref:ATP synthase complex subunit 8 n=1 Tax=Thaumetopoea processionea TaxID=499230 RepID=M5BEU8_9NEOP|nr:ATP8 [Thaumetopoea processionea]